jgi:hypothetical protein
VDRCQPLVPGRNRAIPAVFKISKEPPYGIGGNVEDIQIIDGLAGLPSDKRDEQSQGVPAVALRTSGQIPLIDQVFEKKATDPWAEPIAVSHDSPPRKHIWRSAYLPRATAQES